MKKILFALFFYSTVSAQIPYAHEESRHKVVLENEYVRLLEGHVPFQDTTLAHIHASNAVVVFLSKSTFGIQNVGDKPVVTKVNPGDVVYRAYGDKPVTHLVWDQDTSAFDFMVVDLIKQHPSNDTCSILSKEGVDLQWQTKLVSTYKLTLAKGKFRKLPKSNCAYLLIRISGAKTRARSASRSATSDFRFFPPLSEVEIKGINNDNTMCILLEFK